MPQTLGVAVIGAATALMAGTIGLVQNDIKRVLAHRPCRSSAVPGDGRRRLRRRHLHLTRTRFKALLSPGSGAVITRSPASRICAARALRPDLLITYWTFLIGALAIAGSRPGWLLQQGRDPVPRSRAVTWCCG
jgi:NADH-quinone oxidoreductase subunit L